MHVQTIQMRRKFESVRAAVNSFEFIRSLWETLRAWRIGSRGSRILPLNDFFASFQNLQAKIEELNQWRIDSEDI